jgi:hypothetical protein
MRTLSARRHCWATAGYDVGRKREVETVRKSVHRLSTAADRYSAIGSKPEFSAVVFAGAALLLWDSALNRIPSDLRPSLAFSHPDGDGFSNYSFLNQFGAPNFRFS